LRDPVYPPLACTVRGCGLRLTRLSGAYVCDAGHSHDVARSGYVNLLQPQDRRSAHPGDSRESVAARARLLGDGVGAAIVAALATTAAALRLPAGAAIADLGCGGGDALAAVSAATDGAGIGIDISTAAVDAAARRFPDATWVVANADRRLPLLDGSITLAVSLHARRNPPECARVVHDGGFLLIAVPAADDLIELRAHVQGEAIERPRATAVVDEHMTLFSLVSQQTVREHHRLDRRQLLDLLSGTYRGARTSTAARVEELTSLDVTVASELLLFRKSNHEAHEHLERDSS
jgi:23S rRNA (guanine745-N1)-methyltransferase